MKIAEISAFDVATENMEWPWFAFDASGTRFAYPAGPTQVATQRYDGDRTLPGPIFTLPDDMTMSVVQGFALHRDGQELALVVLVEDRSELVICRPDAAAKRVNLGEHFGSARGLDATARARAVTYDRQGSRLWISADTETDSLVALVDATTHAFLGASRGRLFPPPAMHELYIHPVDDAVLLLASCGQDGTFARVVGHAGDTVEAISTPLDDGAVPAGFVGFSADATRVHLAEADELRTHAWPGLVELSSVELADDFISNYSGAVFGEGILVDGFIEGGADDAVMHFDKSALYGQVLAPPVPLGMWAGRIGRDAVVTVDPKAKPARGRIVRVTVAPVAN